MNPAKERELAYCETITSVFEQHNQMYSNRTHSILKRFVSIHQSHVRPIVHGKEKAKVEFGSKINVSLVNGYGFVDHLSRDVFNEGGFLIMSVDLYKTRHDFLSCRSDGRSNKWNSGKQEIVERSGYKSRWTAIGSPTEDSNPET